MNGRRDRVHELISADHLFHIQPPVVPYSPSTFQSLMIGESPPAGDRPSPGAGNDFHHSMSITQSAARPRIEIARTAHVRHRLRIARLKMLARNFRPLHPQRRPACGANRYRRIALESAGNHRGKSMKRLARSVDVGISSFD